MQPLKYDEKEHMRVVRKEALEDIDIRMLEGGLDAKKITQYTGLSEADLIWIKKEQLWIKQKDMILDLAHEDLL